jgi:hypothetical protein
MPDVPDLNQVAQAAAIERTVIKPRTALPRKSIWQTNRTVRTPSFSGSDELATPSEFPSPRIPEASGSDELNTPADVPSPEDISGYSVVFSPDGTRRSPKRDSIAASAAFVDASGVSWPRWQG